MKKVLVICENPNCSKEFFRSIGEFNRRKKLNKKQYCSMSCYGKAQGKSNLEFADPIKFRNAQQNIKNHCDNRRDDLTPFRYYTHVVRNRKKKESNIDEPYLKTLWDTQNGICPYTGWELVLPSNVEGWANGLQIESASLDRIDSSKGYMKGNVQFISVMANWGKNNRSEDDLIKFCMAVAKHRKQN